MPKKHLLFLVHGMGDHKDGWADAPTTVLRNAYEEYGLSPAFDDQVVIEPLSYSALFATYVSTMQGRIDALAKLPLPANAGGIGKQVIETTQGLTTDSWFVEYFGDVLLYAFTPIRNQVIAHVAAQLTAKLQQHQPYAWSIVAHSQGTRVMHDVLQAMYSHPTNPLPTKPTLYMTIANVSRLFEPYLPKPEVYKSLVYPGGVRSGCCYHFVDVAHQLDPFTWFRPFEPSAGWAGGGPYRDGRFLELSVPARALLNPNPHNLEQYLTWPATHVPVLRALFDLSPNDPSIITAADIARETEDFYEQVIRNSLDPHIEKLKKLRDKAVTTERALVKLAGEFGTLMESV
jgi:hypothetical protein